jgi:hypothetical protein
MSSLNSAPRSIPGLKSLYERDLVIKRAVNTFGFMLLVAVGIRWASQPARSGESPADLSFEAAMGEWVPVGALVLAALAAIVVLQRYLWVKKVFTQGIVIKATVEKLEVHSSTSDLRKSHGRKPAPRRSYYATLRYAVHGVDQTKELRLPNSGFTYGLSKGGETDLMVLEWAPTRPLIRAVYLGR